MKDEIKKQGVRTMLNVSRVGQQVSFRALSSADLNQKYQASPAAASTEETAAPKKSHKALTAIGVVAALAGAVYLAKTGRLGETAKNYVAKASEIVTPYLESAKTYVTGTYESVKTKVLELKDKAVGVFNKAKKTAE